MVSQSIISYSETEMKVFLTQIGVYWRHASHGSFSDEQNYGKNGTSILIALVDVSQINVSTLML